MREGYFVSYSRVDGADFALKLADELQAGPPPTEVWVDTRELVPGRADWDDQIVEAIQTARAVLFVMTSDSVRVGSSCKDEWVAALRYKKPVIPLRVDPEAGLPFRLSSRQWVDFSEQFDVGLAQLRRYLRWADTPEGVLQELRYRLSDAERESPRVAEAQRPRVEQEIEQLQRQIDHQRQVVEDPSAAQDATTTRVASALEREREPQRPKTNRARSRFVNPPPMLAPTYFQDREIETRLLAEFVRSDELRIMSLVGRGGVGKTAIVCRLLKALESGGLPDDLGSWVVESIVYLSPVGKHPVTFANLFTDLCRVLPEERSKQLLERHRDPSARPNELMLSVLEALGTSRTLVLLDNFEDVLDLQTSDFLDEALQEALFTLLRAPVHAVKAIITSRASPGRLLLVEPARQRNVNLDEGLGSPYAEQILRAMDPDGSLGLRDAPDDLLERAKERTRGFPRAVEALAAILAVDHDTTLAQLVEDTNPLPENVVEALVGEAFNRLDVMAQQIVQVLAVFTTPVPAVAVDFVLQLYYPAIDSAPVLSQLVGNLFVKREEGRYYLHQVDRDYALQRVEPGNENDGAKGARAPFTQQALRRRAADYFVKTRTPRQTWRTIDDLAPQLAEFELRAQAREYDAASQILQSITPQYLYLWGHHRLACTLHERLEGHALDPWMQARNKMELATCYHALGDANKSIGLLEEALPIFQELGDRDNELTCLGSLSVVHGVSGEFKLARELTVRALTIARETLNREAEATLLANLALNDAALGDTASALEHGQQALAVANEGDYPRGKAHRTNVLGGLYFEAGDWPLATEHYLSAIETADEIGFAQVSYEARVDLAIVHLHSGNLEAAAKHAESAGAYDFPLQAQDAPLILGIIRLHQGKIDAARAALSEAIVAAEGLMKRNRRHGTALDARALAICGLVVSGDAERIDEAREDFRLARAVLPAPGVIRRVLRLFDAIAAVDAGQLLAALRRDAAGPSHES